MMINEHDIFCYVFFPEVLSPVKKEIIEENSTYREALEFYLSLKKDMGNTPDYNLKEKIAAKIPAYTLSNVIRLFPMKEHLHPGTNGRLAAASKELVPKMYTKTFVDTEKEYLIKFLHFEDITKVFVFSTKNEVVKDFDIVTHPDNLRYHFKDNSEPLEIKESIEIESLTIEII